MTSRIAAGLAAAAALASALSPLAAKAGVGRWTSGYGQGINEATVENTAGTTFYVSCPDAGLNQPPSLTLEPKALRGGANIASVGALVTIGGQNTAVTFQRKVLDQNQVIFTWDATTMPAKRALGALIGRMERGRSVTVSLPSQSIRETFTLVGSREALAGCLT